MDKLAEPGESSRKLQALSGKQNPRAIEPRGV
jgi:hypothetical protein